MKKPQKTSILLAHQIVDEIVEEGLEPGTALLSESDMLERYAVSRGTLRETMRILETHGVVTIKTGPGGGAVVAGPGPRSLASMIALTLQVEGAPFAAVVDARLQLEPLLASEAATRRGKKDLVALRRAIEEMERSSDDPGTFLAQNHAFHAAVARAAKSPVLYRVVDSLNWIQDGTPLGVQYGQATLEEILAAHRHIYEAIEAKEAGEAATAMRRHIEAFAKHAKRDHAHLLKEPLRWEQVDP